MDRPATLSDHLTPLPAWDHLVTALVAGWAEVVGGSLSRCEPSRSESDRADRLSSHFSGVAWTWRR